MTLLNFTYQKNVGEWSLDCFGVEIARNPDERNHRFLEEALELVQSLGATREECHDLVNYVFNREAGEPVQEVGGVAVCLAALCNAHRFDLNGCAETELIRIDTKEMMAKIREKHAAKPKFGRLKPRDTKKMWARDLTDAELLTELARVDARLDEGFGDHGGSPGEWWYERREEIETQLKKRNLPDPWAEARKSGKMLVEQ